MTKPSKLGRKAHLKLGAGAIGLLALATFAAFLGSPEHTEQLTGGSQAEFNVDMVNSAKTKQNTPTKVKNAEEIEKKTLPHIVFIMIDDIGWNDMGYQSSDLENMTPYMNELSADGVRFNRFYSQSLCTPARGALLSGKYPIHTGLQHWQIEPAQPWGLPLRHTLLPEYLQEIGYTTHLMGKWHLGHYNNESTPLFRGFDSFYGFYGGGENYLTMVSEDSCHQTYDGKGISCYKDFMKGIYTEEQGTKIYNTELIRNQAQHVIRNHDPDEPLFMLLAFPNNHVPLMAPDYIMEDHRELLDKIPNEDRKTYGAMLILLDKAIKKVVRSLEESGLYENSIIIVQSDNGGNPAAGGNNYPLRGLKKYMWEGGVRVPAFIHSPLLDPEAIGTTYEEYIHVTDWMPTILEGMCGVNLENIVGQGKWDGVNQWTSINNPGTEGPRNEILVNIDYMDSNGDYLGFERAALIQGDWKLIVHENVVGWYDVPEGANENIEVTAGGSKIYLYNIKDDPYEEENLRNNETELVYDMFVTLKDYLESMIPSNYREEDQDAYVQFDEAGFITSWVPSDEDPEYTAGRVKIDPDREIYENAMRGTLSGDGPTDDATLS